MSRRRKKCASSEKNKRRSLIFLKWWCLCQQMAGEKRVAPSTKVITHIKKESILNNILANVCIILCSRHHNLHSFRTKKRDSELFFFFSCFFTSSFYSFACFCMSPSFYLFSFIIHCTYCVKLWSFRKSKKEKNFPFSPRTFKLIFNFYHL